MKDKTLVWIERLVLFLLISLGAREVCGQTKQYSNSTTNNSTTFNILDPLNPYVNIVQNGGQTQNDNNTVATIEARALANGRLDLNYNTTILANTDFYIRVDGNSASGLLNGLLGGAVGNLLSDLLLSYRIRVRVKNGGLGASSLLDYISDSNSEGTKLNVYRNKGGDYFFKVSPTQNYNRIEIHHEGLGLLSLLNTSTLGVYSGYYYTGVNDCMEMLTTFGNNQGLLTALSGTPVTNMINAIDDDINTYSAINGATVSIGNSVYQSFSLPYEAVNKNIQIKIELPDGLLSLDVGQGVYVDAYNNGVSVYSQQLTDYFLGLNLLGGVVNGLSPRFIRFNPGVAFDEVRVRLVNPISVALGTPVKLYDVAVVDPEPNVSQIVCTVNGTFNLNTIVPGYSASNTYKYFTYQGEEITTPMAVKPGSYLVKGVTESGYCANQYVYITATQTEQYTITGKANHTVVQGTSITFPQYTTDLPDVTAANIRIYDINGVQVTGPVSFPQLGTYYYTVKAINNTGNCEVVKRLTVYVYDQATCGFRYEKYHATNTTDWGTVSLLGIPLGAINDRAKAGDGDLSTYSTISNIVSLFGIGTTYQDLKFAAPVTAGTPVTVKIGQTFSLAQVIGGITVVGLDASGNPIGNLQSVGDAALLNLLAGENVLEYTFTPTATNGSHPAYQGVRILLGSVLGLANNMNVYGAYINRNVPVQDNTGNCTIDPNVVVNGAVIPGNTEATLTLNNTAQDVLWGVQDPGLGLATSLSSVLYPYQAVDNNLDTYAVFNTAVSVLNKQTLTAKFKQVARPGDEVRIIIGSQNVGVLNLNLLADFKIQRYMENAPVGDLLTNQNFSLVDLNVLGLLGSNPSRKAIIVSAIDVPFDRVEISHTKLAAVQLLGEYTYIYDVAVIPNLEFDNIISADGRVDLCLSQPLSIEKLDNCTGYIVSLAHKVTTAGVDSYVDIPNSTLSVVSDQNGIISYGLIQTYSNYNELLYLKIQTTRSGCSFGETQYFSVRISNCQTISNPMIRSRLKSN